MTHLGSQISALADGQLPPAAAERAMSHVAACSDCAAELAAARAARKLLAAAFDVPVTPELTQRLLALGAEREAARPAGRPPATAQRFTGPSLPMPGTGASRRMPADCLHGDLTATRTAQHKLGVAALAGVGMLAAALFALGDLPPVVPDPHPANALTVLGRAGDAAARQPEPVAVAGGAAIHQAVLPWRPSGDQDADDAATPRDGTAESADDPASGSFGMPAVDLDLSTQGSEDVVSDWMRRHGWTPLEDLPDGYRVTAVRTDAAGGRLEVDLDGSAGLIVVTQEHGRLDPTGARSMPVEAGGGAEVYVLSHAPWHGVWQSGDTVVSVVAEVPSEALGTVLDSYPARPCDQGVAARIARGWGRVAAPWRT